AEEKKEWAPVAGREVPYFLKLSAARCAWTSYTNHEKQCTSEDVIRMWDRLSGSTPKHMGPFEHQACPSDDKDVGGNLGKGWFQLRKVFAQENITEFRPPAAEVAQWEKDLGHLVS